MSNGPTIAWRRARRTIGTLVRTDTGAGIVLLAAGVAALAWANSPWQDGYVHLWHTKLSLGLGDWSLSEDLQHWINDGLMAVFFFVVGLEIKRELVDGDLRDARTAAVPVIAALGGMVVPALCYFAINAGHPGSRGWGIPMATDIAFALGVVALLGPRIPAGLRLFLLTLAIVDDIGAIVVIAVFYTDNLNLTALSIALLLVGAIVALRHLQVAVVAIYVILGAGLWLATYQSGVHATIAGVVLGLLVPARTVAPAPTPPGRSVAERTEHVLRPWTGFVIVPLFALANAGVIIRASAFDAPGASRVTVGVVVGLVAGKAIGITAATWLAVRLRVGRLPPGASWAGVAGVAVRCRDRLHRLVVRHRAGLPRRQPAGGCGEGRHGRRVITGGDHRCDGPAQTSCSRARPVNATAGEAGAHR